MVQPSRSSSSSAASAGQPSPADLCEPKPNKATTNLDDPQKVMAELHATVTSGDLDLDMSLQRIAEAAQKLTGASGAAIAIRHNVAIVCSARAGESAPELGARLDVDSGISGECLRTGAALRCRDTNKDQRVNVDVCRKLHLRSLAVAPLLAESGAIGILEVFSDLPDSFSDQHLQLLEGLAELVASARIRFAEAASRLPSRTLVGEQSATSSALALARVNRLIGSFGQKMIRPLAKLTGGDQTSLRLETARLVRLTITALAVGGIFLALRRPPSSVNPRPASLPAARALVENPTQSLAASAVPLGSPVSSPVSSSGPTSLSSVFEARASGATTKNLKPSLASARTHQSSPPLDVADDLVLRALDGHSSSDSTTTENPPQTPTISESADELPPQDSDPLVASVPATSSDPLNVLLSMPAVVPAAALPVSQGISEGMVVHRIQPTYPEQARTMRLEGRVVLRAIVTPDGALRELKVVKGHPVLARAAVDAVSQWRYRPYQLNGKPVSMQTDITIDFKLP